MPDGAESTTVSVPFGPVSPVPVPAIPSSEAILQQGRGLALSGVPLQLGSLLEALAELRAKSTGSTATIFPQITTQIDDLRKQYAQASRALARRLGAAGGGFRQRNQTQLLSQASRQYGNLLAGQQQEGFAGLLNTLGNLQPFLGASARASQVSTQPGRPVNPAVSGAAAADLAEVAGRIFQSSGTPTAPTATTVAVPVDYTGVNSLY